MKRKTITAIIPAFNEEQNIERCVKSLLWCDKVIVMFMGDDSTGEIARKFGAKIVVKNKKQKADFVAVQENINWAIDHCQTDWMIRVDADEVCTLELEKEIKAIINSSSIIVAYGIGREQFFGGKFLKGGDWFYDRLIRLCKTGSCRYSPVKAVHEQFKVYGKTGILKSKLLHYSHPTYQDAIFKYKLYALAEVKDLRESKILAFRKMFFNPPYVFLRWFFWHHGYRDGVRGIVAAGLRAWYEFILYRQYLFSGSKT